MNILITGAKGFVGRNLIENLKTIRDGKDRTRPDLRIDALYEYDLGNTPEELDAFCADCDFVFNLAGVNRPKDPKEFREGNFGFASALLNALKKHNNKCPVMLSSSLQATLAGRFGTSEYGVSKRDGEELFFTYAAETGAKVYVYRFPTLELLFIDDLIDEMYDAMEGRPHRAEYPKAGETVDGVMYDGLTPRPCEDGRYCYAPVTHKATLGRIVELLYTFRDQPQTLMMPAIPNGSLEKKLYSMYLSYLPREKVAFDLKMNCDARGSFTELLKTADHGQFSVNISKPGITKGQHWHNTKWEYFIVVAGHGLIQERRIGTDEVIEFEVSGDRIQAVHMLPGYTHNIKNLSDTENLVTLMWANEIFDPNHPDTYFETVQ